MTTDPWPADDPQPGDFDAALADIDPGLIEHHDGKPNAELRILTPIVPPRKQSSPRRDGFA